jgi:hypothetical protein
MNVVITNEYIEENTYNNNTIIVRKELPEIKNKFELLCKTIKYYLDENIKSNELTIIPNYTLNYNTCICSCNRCKDLFILTSKDKDIKLGVGSFCMKKFGNEKINAQIYNMTKAKRCEECKTSLVIKDNPYFQINCKRGDSLCVDCKNKKIYLNVPYSLKDNVKLYGGLWDNNKKKWYIYRNNNKYYYLINKYL